MDFLKKHGCYDRKVVKNCTSCRVKLPVRSKHHFLCTNCWKEKIGRSGSVYARFMRAVHPERFRKKGDLL